MYSASRAAVGGSRVELGDGRAQGVREHDPLVGGLRRDEKLVDPKPSENVGCAAGPREDLHRIQAVIVELRPRGTDRPVTSPAQRVISERGGGAGTGQRRKTVAGVPSVGCSAVGREVAVRVVGERKPVPGALSIGGVVRRGGHGVGQQRAGEEPTHGEAVARRIVLVAQITEETRALR